MPDLVHRHSDIESNILRLEEGHVLMRAGLRRAACFSNSLSELGLRGATEIPPEDISPCLIGGMGSRASGEEVRRLGSGCMC